MNPKLSICTTVKNRSRIQVGEHELRLFPNCVKSIVDAVDDGIGCELVVADWRSDDWPLDEWLEVAAAPIPVRTVHADGAFSRGRGRNLAAAAARGDIIFFLDADSLINESVIRHGIQCLRDGKSYFPIVFSFDDPDHKTGRWRPSGYGNCMVSRDLYQRVNGWPEYGSWGNEDKHFFEQISSVHPTIRQDEPGFYHQWHPSELQWKDRYSEETRKAMRTIKEITDLLPTGSTVILVDQGELHRYPIVDSFTLPFLERHGEYCGPPPDDASALHELERMLHEGAEFIVFPWMTFWWLEYYQRFYTHLRNNFRCILQNERLIAFDLTLGADDR